MALPVPPAPRARARAVRSMISDRRTGGKLLTAFVLAGSTDVPLQQASPAVPSHEAGTAVGDHIAELDSPPQAGEGRRPGVRRAGLAAATQTMSSTLVVAGLIGLLGVCGAAVLIVQGVTGPVGRAVRVLRGPDKGRRGRRDHRLRATALHGFQSMSRAVATAGDASLRVAPEIATDARSLATGCDGASPTSGPPPGTRSAVTIVAPTGREPAGEAAKVAGAVTAASTPDAGATTTRYAAARSRALGPTIALWHAVELDRLVGAVGGACETAVCGSLVRVSTEQRWQIPARDVCPSCSTLAR